MMTRFTKVFAGLLAVTYLTGCSGDNIPPAGSRPNIVLIMADDLGFSDLGIHGNSIVETPNLDRFASESVQFSQFYVTPVCATTRAALLTGRHFLRTGVSHVHGGKDFLHLDEVTLANRLKDEGYATGMWGKWHSGKTPGYFPWERGFDEAFMARLYKYRNNIGLMNGREVQTEGWVTGVLTDYAIDFIKRNRERPFFAYLPYLTCHAPLVAPDNYSMKYQEKGLSEKLATLYGMVDHLDHQIGRLLSALETLGLAENTIVLFLSDNGPAVLNGILTDEDRKIRYVNGLRGHKGNIWDNGIRSPLYVRWKGKYLPATVDQLADVTDLFPTLTELSGAIPGKDLPVPDGRSIVPYLEASGKTIPGKEVFLYANRGWPPTDLPWTPQGVKDEYRPWKYEGGGNLLYENQIMGIRGERYKLLLNPGPTDGTIEPDESGYVLMDMVADPREEMNIIEDNPEVFESMKSSLELWHSSVFYDTHAFEMPVFKLGSDTSISYKVLAYAPQMMSNEVKSASNYISNFKHSGDFVVYRIHTAESGIYNMEFRYKLTGQDSRAMEIVFPWYHGMVTFDTESDIVYERNVPIIEGFTNITLENVKGHTEGELRLYEILIITH